MSEQNEHNSTVTASLQWLGSLLEYILALLIILECSSMIISTQTGNTVSAGDIVRWMILVLLAALNVIHIAAAGIEKRITLRGVLKFCVIPAAVFACSLLFFHFNVLKLHPSSSSAFIKKYLIALPLFIAFFYMKRKEGSAFDFIFKYSDVVCCFCVLNLTVYFASTLMPDSLPGDIAYTRWSSNGGLRLCINYLNLCMGRPGVKWEGTLDWLRNYGVFTEPLMFGIPLLTSLYAELFLRTADGESRGISKTGRWFRCALLTAASVTAQSAIVIILMLAGWTLHVLRILVVKHRKKLVIAIVVALLVAASAAVVALKQSEVYESTDSTMNSVEQHIDDVVVGMKAFLAKPLLGGGYGNDAYRQSFMTEQRYTINRGSSNTAFSVLAQGGIVLGLLCMTPYFVLIRPFFSKKERDKSMALWGLGMFGMYLFVVFNYRYYLMMIMGMGYAMIPRERKTAEQSSPEQKAGGIKEWIFIAALLCASVLLVLFGGPVWTWLYRWLKSGQLLIGQSPCGVLCLWIALLVNAYIAVTALEGTLSRIWLLIAAGYDLVCVLLYSRVLSYTETVLSFGNGSYIGTEHLVLLLLYAGGWLLLKAVREWIRAGRRRDAAKKEAAKDVSLTVVFLAAAGIVAAGFAVMGNMNRIADRKSDVAMVTDHASGTVYANDVPALYHLQNRRVSLTGAKDEGFSIYKNTSVICSAGTALRELFNSGFEVTRLSDDLVVYSNDQSLIDALAGEGYTFYRYYPYEVDADLEDMARRSKNAVGSNGVILNKKNPLDKGPYEILDEGSYTVTYSLHLSGKSRIDSPDDTVICTLKVINNLTADAVAEQSVPLSRFDEKGNAVIDVPFTLLWNIGDRMEYEIYPEEGYKVACSRITRRETPSYVTVRTYNGHRDVIREEYYDTEDDKPYAQAAGYSAVSRTFNLGDQLLSARYELYGEPAMTTWGYTGLDYTYNRKGSVVGIRYFGTDGGPVMLPGGYAGVAREYDSVGRMTCERYLDESGDPVMIQAGYAEIHNTFDEEGNVIRVEYDDGNGSPVVNTSGFAALERSYDENGRATDERYYGLSGERILNTSGYAERKRQYDESGRVTAEQYYGTDGEPIQCTSGYYGAKMSYDAAGNTSEWAVVDQNGDPMSDVNGVSVYRYEYDGKRRRIADYFFDTAGNPVECTGGYSEVHRTYDDTGNLVSQVLLNLAGETVG